MKKTIYLCLASILILASCKNDEKKNETTQKTIGLLTISTEKPQPGETIDITYKKDSVSDAFLNYMVNTKNYPLDLDFKTENNEQKASVKIPDSANAIAFVFKSGEDYDTNDEKGYILPLYDAEGKQIPGSNSAAAFYSIRNGSYYGVKVENTIVEKTIKEDLSTYPNLKDEWETSYLQLAYQNNKVKAKPLIEDFITNLSKKTDKSELEYMDMMNFYSTLEEKPKSDSIKTIILEKFPEGQTANYELSKQFYKEPNLDKKLQLFEDYTKRNTKMDNFSNSMATSLALAYFNEGGMDNFKKYSAMVDDKQRMAYDFNNVAWSLAEKGENIEGAEELSKMTLEIVENLQKDPTKGKPVYSTQKNYEKGLESMYSMFADTYALVKFKQGDVKEAIVYQEKAHDPKATDTEANARYISYLMADNRYDTTIEKAGKFIKLGNYNTDIVEAYETAYREVNNSSDGLEEKISQLKEEGKQLLISEIKSKMISEDAPQFALKNMRGESIALKDLKGKVVILDFWATWCGPCKASFPGMQKVVTKYKDDENVEFLFIDTFERGKNREKDVEGFISKNNYTFNVIYDTQKENSRDFEVAEKYEVDGIPTKVIIGPDGKIRLKSVGYGGSTAKLIEEMDIVIDILKS
ncbi:TlpA family protein disulfide reductase [Winogradskyella sp. MH6]|uniref:TlpA family protein disulfide reductase n=1 Tax=Winogradskyella sp. MH6 TaxID=2929510 RepID=UPI001FB21D34|nr:TlpA disulfide reductase family protein [Winogradskyella sp. MH6]